MIKTMIRSMIKPMVRGMIGVDLTYDELVLATSPTRYYLQDETSGTAIVDAIGAKNGTYSGSYTLDDGSLLASGLGSSVDSLGTSDPYLPQDGDFNVGTGDYTWMFLIKTNTTHNDKFLIDLRQSDTSGYLINFGGYGGSLAGSLQFASSTFTVTGTSTIDDGGIYHCVCRRASGVASVWVNGTKESSGADTTSYTRQIGAISFMHSGFNNNFTNAVTSRLAYWNSAVSDGDIAAIAAKSGA